MRLAAAELVATIEGGDPAYSSHLSQQHAMPQLRRVDEPTATQMLERLVGISVEALKEPASEQMQEHSAQAPSPQAADEGVTVAVAKARR